MDCEKQFGNYHTAQADAARHAGVSGHTIRGKIISVFEYGPVRDRALRARPDITIQCPSEVSHQGY